MVYLEEAIRSVLNQTDPDWRLTVVDDRFPSEAPAKWLESLGDPRITYLSNEENLGVTGNFNRCIELSTADRTRLWQRSCELNERKLALLSITDMEKRSLDQIWL